MQVGIVKLDARLTATRAPNERSVSRLVVNDKAPKRDELRASGGCDRTQEQQVANLLSGFRTEASWLTGGSYANTVRMRSFSSVGWGGRRHAD